MARTRNSKESNSKTSTRHDDADENSKSKNCKDHAMAKQGLWDGDLDLIVFGFFVVYRMKVNYTRENCKSHRAT